jgi:hypothetical protein
MRLPAFLAVLLSPSLALAHPGHGALPGDSLSHWIADPLHAGAVATAVVLTLVAARALMAPRAR